MISLCPSCPGPSVCTPIPSVGPTPCSFLFLGAGPGKVECATQIPYTGLAGQELDATYLSVAGLPRDTVHVGNCCLCFDGSDRIPDRRLLDCARTHIPELLDRVRPEVVVLMGGQACKIADQRIRLDMQHGRPFRGSIYGYETWVWPSYEPALGMRDTGKMTPLLDDFTHLGQWWRGEWTPPVSEERKTNYLLVNSNRVASYYQQWHFDVPWCAVDTEKHGSAPWSVQWSQCAGQARMVLADDKESLELLAALLPTVEVILHNAPGDLDTLDQLGIHLNRYRDTMHVFSAADAGADQVVEGEGGIERHVRFVLALASPGGGVGITVIAVFVEDDHDGAHLAAHLLELAHIDAAFVPFADGLAHVDAVEDRSGERLDADAVFREQVLALLFEEAAVVFDHQVFRRIRTDAGTVDLAGPFAREFLLLARPQ